MKPSPVNDRKERLAAALKENLKRRKAKTRANAGVVEQAAVRDADTALPARFENPPSLGPKTAPKRI